MKKRNLIGVLTFCYFCWTAPAMAGTIDIFADHTEAFASVTYDSGVVSNPGTTRPEFSGALFPAGVFGGFDLDGTRSAEVPVGGGYSDTTFYNAHTYFSETSSGYRNVVSLGTSAFNQLGATGLASGGSSMDLGFTVSGADSAMNLSVSVEGLTHGWLTLYDETTSSVVHHLELQNTWDHLALYDVALQDSHSYRLLGYLYAETPLSGDPSGNFEFNFLNSDITSSVPEPATWMLMFSSFLGLIGYRRKLK